MTYEVLTVGGQSIFSGADYEEAVYQRDEFNNEYPELGAYIVSCDGTNTLTREQVCNLIGEEVYEDIYEMVFGEPTMQDILNYLNV